MSRERNASWRARPTGSGTSSPRNGAKPRASSPTTSRFSRHGSGIPGYRLPVPRDFTLTIEEQDYATLYSLDHEQMAWGRNKISELGDDLLFKQEYPVNAAEAFQLSGHDSYIKSILITKARKSDIVGSGPLVIGYDPAWMGADHHAMAHRRGRQVEKIETKSKLDTMQ